MRHALKHIKEISTVDDVRNIDSVGLKELVKDILPSIFYLSRAHVFEEKCGKHQIMEAIDSNPTCEQASLDVFTPCLGPAEWLYKIQLPGIHSGRDWTKWYIQQVLRCSGWDVVHFDQYPQTLPKMQTEMEELDDVPGKYIHRDKVCSKFHNKGICPHVWLLRTPGTTIILIATYIQHPSKLFLYEKKRYGLVQPSRSSSSKVPERLCSSSGMHVCAACEVYVYVDTHK